MSPESRSRLAGNETASKDPADGLNHLHSRIFAVLAGEAQPHELPAALHDLWCDGFHVGQVRAQARVDRAERAADIYYDLAFNGEAARARHSSLLKHFDVVQARKAVSA